MKTGTIIPALAAAFISLNAFCAPAGQQDSTVGLSDAVTTSPASVNFHRVSHDGVSFEAPDSCIELHGNGLTVKYPDGTFGVSLSTEPRRGSDQKRCLQLCKSLAAKMHIKDAEVKKVKINGKNGAVASGFLESQRVSIAILPDGNKELTCIVMNDPSRAAWADRVIRTLR